RKDVQYAFFLLLALWGSLRFWESKNWLFYLLAVICFLVAYYSKYAAAMFPILYVSLALFWQKRNDYKRLVLEAIPFFLLPLNTLYLSIKHKAAIRPVTVTENVSEVASTSTNEVEYIGGNLITGNQMTVDRIN